MELTLTTPSVLFPAITLLLLAYTNRYLAIASLIRGLHARYKQEPKAEIVSQLKTLRTRLTLIRFMQSLGIMSLFLCVLSIFFMLMSFAQVGGYIFGVSLVLLMFSLLFSLREIQISTNALNIQLSDISEFKALGGKK